MTLWASPADGPSTSVGPGSRLGDRYELVRPIASGGMAQVWLATDTVLDRTVAAKILHPHLATDAGFVARFRREAVAAARLSHPSIVAVFDTVSFGGLEAMVMELIDGRTLRAVLDEVGAMPVDDVLHVGISIASALDEAHRAGIVHRDIKPANIMMANDRRVLVTDFGIAKAGTDADLTATGTLLGTAKYLSPEQVTGGPMDPRSDLYSLGVMLFEALTGVVPFKADTDAATALARLHQDPPSLRQLRPNVPPELEAIVAKLMARNPDHRFSRASALQEALVRLRANLPSGSGPAGSGPAGPFGLTVPLVPPAPPSGPDRPPPPVFPGASGPDRLPPPVLPGASGPGAGDAGIGARSLAAAAAVTGPAGHGGPVVADRPRPPDPPAGTVQGPPLQIEPAAGRFGPPSTSPGPLSSGPLPVVRPASPGGPPHLTPPGPAGRPVSGPLLANPPLSSHPSGPLPLVAGRGGPEQLRVVRSRRSRLISVLVVAALVGLLVLAVLTRVGPFDSSGSSEDDAIDETGPGLTIAGARSFDPLTDNAEKLEREDLVPFAYDGDRTTAWATETYRQAQLSGLKAGVGLILQLGTTAEVRRLELVTNTVGWSAEIYVGDQFGPDPASWGLPAAIVTSGTPEMVLDLDEGAEGSLVLVWLRDTGRTGDRFRFELAEATIR